MERLLRQASLNVLRDAVERRDAAVEGERLEALAHFCGLVKAEMITPEALYERLNFDPDTDYFPAAFAEAERLLEAEGMMTYADLLYRPLQVLELIAPYGLALKAFWIMSLLMNTRILTPLSSAFYPCW
ncbi:hypothetical protein HSBAA_25510 [Vreelandella sulfidaeris]|uniref:Uncharacterized protein n=1 Tax=Vreelandella sulfidaeris TaxID=115553 RepID=A0A455U5L9_9GAMM|nr:hypothetical protein HSBAA_25510 [Halomonas sulfidaeris]